MDEGIWKRVPPDMFDSSLRSLNPVTRYYHGWRYARIRKHITARFRNGMRILDLGSGGSCWNTPGLPVTGVDSSELMLRHGMERGRLGSYIVWNLEKGMVPLEGGSFDFVVLSEVLEHLKRPEGAVREARRLLKKGGLLIATVPLDAPLSLWSVLFGLECLVAGDILGNEFYRRRCGHVHHFSARSFGALLEENGFTPLERNLTPLNILIVAGKGGFSPSGPGKR